jgi:hypothetical protein
MIEASGMSE